MDGKQSSGFSWPVFFVAFAAIVAVYVTLAAAAWGSGFHDSVVEGPTYFKADVSSGNPAIAPVGEDSDVIALGSLSHATVKVTKVPNGSQVAYDVRVVIGRKVLRPNKDYSVSFAPDFDKGKTAVMVVGKNRYRGSRLLYI